MRALAVIVLVAAAPAFADHHHTVTDEGAGAGVTANVSLLAATFAPSQSSMMDYDGNYEGVIAGAMWSRARFAAGASWAYYRLIRNGNELYGAGDIVVHGQAALYAHDAVQAGALLALSVPSGDDRSGFGMGHPMVMPAGYAAWSDHVMTVSASFGYSRALASGAHAHGMAPLVEPMNMSELTWSAGADLAVASSVRIGGRASGGVPVGSLAGVDRVVGALRAAWGSGRVETSAELQAGLVGDPFTIRGVVSTALRF